MTRQRSTLTTGLAVFSVLTSFVFVYAGLSLLSAEGAPEWNRVFGYVAAGYGLGNVYILSFAWRTGGGWTLWANQLIALCFFGAFLIDLFRSGVENPLQYLGALGVAAVLAVNRYLIRRLAREQG